VAPKTLVSVGLRVTMSEVGTASPASPGIPAIDTWYLTAERTSGPDRLSGFPPRLLSW
jgi:hypothetical protein